MLLVLRFLMHYHDCAAILFCGHGPPLFLVPLRPSFYGFCISPPSSLISSIRLQVLNSVLAMPIQLYMLVVQIVASTATISTMVGPVPKWTLFSQVHPMGAVPRGWLTRLSLTFIKICSMTTGQFVYYDPIFGSSKNSQQELPVL